MPKPPTSTLLVVEFVCELTQLFYSKNWLFILIVKVMINSYWTKILVYEVGVLPTLGTATKGEMGRARGRGRYWMRGYRGEREKERERGGRGREEEREREGERGREGEGEREREGGGLRRYRGERLR